jgi:hypothetical protein
LENTRNQGPDKETALFWQGEKAAIQVQEINNYLYTGGVQYYYHTPKDNLVTVFF